MHSIDSKVSFTRGQTTIWPHGLRSLRVSEKEHNSFQKEDHAQRLSYSKSLHRYGEVSLTREMVCDEWTDFLIDSLSTAGRVVEKPIIDLCDVKARMKNGSGAVMHRCALRKWELLIQSRRFVSESAELVSLGRSEAQDFVNHATAGQVITGKDCRVKLAIGATNISTADFVETLSRTFSAQIIFSRKIDSARYDRWGVSNRHSFGEWEITGQLVCRLSEEEYNALHGQCTCSIWLECGSGSTKLNIALPSVIAQTDAQDYFNAKVEHRISFMAQTTANIKALIKATHEN